MATYHNITREEMEAFLLPQGFQQITLPNTFELVYAKRVDHHGLALSLRVYSGIVPSGDSRGVGKDAIRVNLFWKNASGEIKKVGGSKRVHRVKGWRFNLGDRLFQWQQQFKQCHNCGSPMVERQGKNGKFWGCGNFPQCRNTEPF